MRAGARFSNHCRRDGHFLAPARTMTRRKRIERDGPGGAPARDSDGKPQKNRSTVFGTTTAVTVTDVGGKRTRSVPQLPPSYDRKTVPARIYRFLLTDENSRLDGFGRPLRCFLAPNQCVVFAKIYVFLENEIIRSGTTRDYEDGRSGVF